MEKTEHNSAYLDFRASAYRKKYEPALLFGGKTFTYGTLLSRVEYAYNTFCQMGIEPHERVCLWLPNCPDLLASFYGLSRLGALGVLAHPADTQGEVRRQMAAADADILITTPGRYEEFCRAGESLPAGRLVLCRPESDMRGSARKAYLAKEKQQEPEEAKGYLLEQLMEENQYNAMDMPFFGDAEEAVMLGGTSSFVQPKFITYSPRELSDTVREFWRHKERVSTLYIHHSFATEGGFLAAHSALSTGRTILWCLQEPYDLLKKQKPDYLVGTEEFFWEIRQRAAALGAKWQNLQGGLQIGKPLTPLMEKFAAKAFAAMGGSGLLCGAPVPLKMLQEPLFFVEDFGVRQRDMEQVLSHLPGIGKCRCVAENGGLRLKVLPNGTEAVSSLGRALVSCCKREMNPLHLPRSVEFCSIL